MNTDLQSGEIAHRTTEAVDYNDGVNMWSMTRIDPAPALTGFIDSYTDYAERTGGFNTRRELPHAEGVLLVNLADPIFITGGDGAELKVDAGEMFFAGPHIRPALSRSAGAQAGMHIHLSLDNLRRLVGAPMHEFIDRVVPVDAVLGGRAAGFGGELVQLKTMEARVGALDAGLAARFRETVPLPRALRHGLALLRGRPDLDISEVAGDIGWSRKHFAARVKDAVGVGPRSFRRLLRFQTLTAAAGRLDSPDWAGLAVDAGYCDQSHMIREFQEFAGMTPGEYQRRSLGHGGGVVEG